MSYFIVYAKVYDRYVHKIHSNPLNNVQTRNQFPAKNVDLVCFM